MTHRGFMPPFMRCKAFTLLELLCAIALIALLAALLLPVVVRARQWCKEWAYGAYAYKENQTEAFLDDSASEARLLKWTTNRPVRWTFIDSSKLSQP